MPKVKWWEVNKEKSAEANKKNKYWETNIRDIILNWTPRKNGLPRDVKFIKVTYGKANFIEFTLFRSEPYTRQLNKMYKNMPIIYDRYRLLITRISLKTKDKNNEWKEIDSAIDMINNIKLLEIYKPSYDQWVELDTLNEIFIKVDEIMSHLDEYIVLDALMA